MTTYWSKEKVFKSNHLECMPALLHVVAFIPTILAFDAQYAQSLFLFIRDLIRKSCVLNNFKLIHLISETYS